MTRYLCTQWRHFTNIHQVSGRVLKGFSRSEVTGQGHSENKCTSCIGDIHFRQYVIEAHLLDFILRDHLQLYIFCVCVKAVVRWCCERRYVDVNTRNNADYTALHESCAAGHCDVASCLIQFGADVHAISKLDGARSVTVLVL